MRKRRYRKFNTDGILWREVDIPNVPVSPTERKKNIFFEKL